MKLIREVEKDNKTLSSENKRLQIFIIIFMVIALCLGTFYFNVICFGTECENKTPRPLIIINPSKANTSENTTGDDVVLSEWMEYILKQDNLTASINRTRIAIDDGEEEINKSVLLNKEQLKEIFSELSIYQIIKMYSLGIGYAGGDTLKISYIKNENTFTVSFANNHIPKSDDEEFNNLIEIVISKEEHEELKNEEGAFYFYQFGNNTNYDAINKIYDKYFN